MSGQIVNFDKSLIYLNNNVDESLKSSVRSILGIQISNNPKKYLSLRTMVGRRKKHALMELKEKVECRIKS